MTQSLLGTDEIILYDHRLPISGPIQEQLVSVFPGKLVIGDPSRADDPLASTMVMNDWTGGVLRQRVINTAVDTARFASSTGTTHFFHQWTLAEATRNLGSASLSNKHVRCGVEFRNQQYVVFDDQLVRVKADETLETVGSAMAASATDMIVYRNMSGASAGSDRIVILTGTSTAYVYDGTTLSSVALTGSGMYLTIWDDKLIVLFYGGSLYSTTDVTVAGLGVVALPGQNTVALPPGSVTDVLIFPDPNGEDALHVATTEGLYFYDETAQKVRQTHLILPRIQYQGEGSEVWRDTLYFNSRQLGVTRFTGSTSDQVGLDRDDGLTRDYRGKITKLARSLNFLLAATESLQESPLGDPIYSGKGWATAAAFYESKGYSAIYGRTETAWHPLVVGTQMGSGCKWVGVSSADGKYRMFFGMNNQLYAMDLHPDVMNVLDNPLTCYEQSAELVTPWTDIGFSGIPKLASVQEFDWDIPTGCTGGQCTAVAYYAKDDTANWYTIKRWETSGIIHDSIKYGTDGLGDVVRTIRFKFAISRCTNTNHTPVLRSSGFVFFKRIQERWGKRITIDGTRAFKGMQPEDIVKLVKDLASPSITPLKGHLKCWVDGIFTEEDVMITGLSLTTAPGSDQRGLCNLSVVST